VAQRWGRLDSRYPAPIGGAATAGPGNRALEVLNQARGIPRAVVGELRFAGWSTSQSGWSPKRSRTRGQLLVRVKSGGNGRTDDRSPGSAIWQARPEQPARGVTVPDDLFRPQLGEPHHSAYVVEDIETTVSRLVDLLGAGPFLLIENVPLENVRSGGEPAEFVHNSAFGRCGDAVIELIEPVRLAPERVQGAFAAPRPRVQHVAYVVPPTEVGDLRSSLDERGLPQYLSSWFGGVETTLHDAAAVLGHDLEIHSDNEGLRGFFAMVRDAAEEWDGSEPLRPLEV
jgi:methylmalonyl-CoA/ethylmalonyl-CoA epimerase